MSANLCTESHLRELLEQAFEVVVVTDATAAAKLPGSTSFHVERSLDAHTMARAAACDGSILPLTLSFS
jgi:biuret amidohydrolase